MWRGWSGRRQDVSRPVQNRSYSRSAANRPYIGLALLAAGAACISACSKAGSGGNPGPGALNLPVPVKVATAVCKDIPVQIRSIARVEPYATVTVKPQVTGQVIDVHFAEGQEVKAGDLLFSIDPRPFEAALRQAEAGLAKDIALAKDAEDEAEWRASLFKQGVAAQREYESSRATADSLRAAVRADEAAVDQARLDLEYCSVQAPLAGRTGRLLTDRGNVVKANEAALVVINQVTPIYVAFSVPEQYLGQIKEHQAAGPLAVEAIIPQAEDPPERGELSFIDNQVDRTTGTILLKGTFLNEGRRLWPGQFVNLVLTLMIRPGAIVVPAQAVQTGQAGQYVFVLGSDHRVESRPVVTGLALDDEIVIEDGVSAGETVVTDGQLRLVPGARAEVKSPASQPEAHP